MASFDRPYRKVYPDLLFGSARIRSLRPHLMGVYMWMLLGSDEYGRMCSGGRPMDEGDLLRLTNCSKLSVLQRSLKDLLDLGLLERDEQGTLCVANDVKIQGIRKRTPMRRVRRVDEQTKPAPYHKEWKRQG